MTKYVSRPQLVEAAPWDSSMEGIVEIRELIKTVGWFVSKTTMILDSEDQLSKVSSYIYIQSDSDRYSYESVYPGNWVILRDGVPKILADEPDAYQEFDQVRDMTVVEWLLDNGALA